ncbi:MAG: sphingosine-1-phosphate lyase [delta proteobacterium MLS_D]|nr:MAG: sphingosine-1-phosphate lyase [delta proteobacterium MLS_D]
MNGDHAAEPFKTVNGDGLLTLPHKGNDRPAILEKLREFSRNDPDYKNMKAWSLVYYLGEDHTNFLLDAYGMFFSANGLNPMAFQSLKRLETEVVRMTATLLHGDRNVVGVVTSGGTESCLLPVKTYRDYGRHARGIRRPNMVIPETAHVAWEKGAEYFGVKAIHAPLDDDWRVDVKAVKKLVNRNTVMILGSAPDYPHGIVDPIAELGEVALDTGTPLHVDACLGGYFLPFAERLGYDIPLWDYRVPGVTSISADTHKYGFSAKGASVLTYRNIDLMRHQMFVYENWPGGVFASPALLGTRPGGAYAAAWAALQALGVEGYTAITKETMEATQRLLDGINGMPELEVIGSPSASVFSYRSVDRKVNIYAVGDLMEKKGWHIDRLQRPEALHAMVTPLHAGVVNEYLDDLARAVETARANPELALQGGAAMYGMIASIPLRGMVRKNILDMFAGMYGPDAKMIDPATASVEGGDDEAGKVTFAEKAAAFYLKLRERFRQ